MLSFHQVFICRGAPPKLLRCLCRWHSRRKGLDIPFLYDSIPRRIVELTQSPESTDSSAADLSSEAPFTQQINSTAASSFQPQPLPKLDRGETWADLSTPGIEQLPKLYKSRNFLKKIKKKLARKIASLHTPHDWYAAARATQRKVILHVGPTNSGKTFSAVESLKRAKTGVYCGPLRLLAHELHEKLTKEGVTCDLITGQQTVLRENSTHTSCTIEMLDTTVPVECAVIDEFQMMADPDRGWAWTRAILGIAARTVHLCGNESCVGLVQELLNESGDVVEVNKYERLSPLQMSPVFSGRVKQGDCIIAFSRKDIYDLKEQVEYTTKFKCCVVYGSLPPETRTQQADLFNDPTSGYDVLIASDAVGMGLNLNIKRIVFSTIEKYDGVEERRLTPAEILQIAGRAGRYQSIYPKGFVTAFDPGHVDYIERALHYPVPAIQKAGLRPTFEQLSLFAHQINETMLAPTLTRFEKMASTSAKYFLCGFREQIEIAELLDQIPMSMKDRYIFSLTPVKITSSTVMNYFVDYASQYAAGQTVRLGISFKSIIGCNSPKKLLELEAIYSVVDMYIWLSQRFNTQFIEHEKAKSLQTETNAIIQELLEGKPDPMIRKFDKKSQKKRRRRLEKQLLKQETEAILQKYLEPDWEL